jgi:hypothetical protein
VFVAADERIVMPGHAAQLAAQHQRIRLDLPAYGCLAASVQPTLCMLVPIGR